jgi:sugar/nucleoside kinase (ribokinase family)
MTKKYHVYGMGNALVDFEIEVSNLELAELNIEKGVMTLIDEPRQAELLKVFKGVQHQRSCGGSAANTIIAAQSFDSPSFYSCKVANDETGLFYRDDLINHGVDTNLSQEQLAEGKTGKCLVLVTPDADRTMNTFLGITGDIDYQQIDEQALLNSEYLYIEGYLSSSPVALAAAVKAMAFARDNNIKTAFSLSDPNMVKFCRDGLEQIIGEGVDILFCNYDEASLYTETKELDLALEKLSQVATTVIVTLSAKGAVILSQGQKIEVVGHAVKAIDTNGAGDLFAGTFLHALANDLSLELAGKIASYASSLLVTQFGARLTPEATQEVKRFANELIAKC